ncbi:hypothetical protein SASPL_103386 [Salvia splendens]|uniref:Uncharacterized protein n=1 Tax=Salvia splendens TaxID=180675 RepID=A0A8X8YT05_SALSN|nr:hypothetical protein SASPL_103386 [Salvia splendens]
MLTCFQTSVISSSMFLTAMASTIGMQIGWVDWRSPDAPKLAREKLAAMGPMSKNEIIMAGTLVLRVGLWYAGCGFSERRHIRTVSAAYNRGSDVEGMPSRIPKPLLRRIGAIVAAVIGAMFTAFLSVATAMGTPPYLGPCVLSFVSNLMGGLTHRVRATCPLALGGDTDSSSPSSISLFGSKAIGLC